LRCQSFRGSPDDIAHPSFGPEHQQELDHRAACRGAWTCVAACRPEDSTVATLDGQNEKVPPATVSVVGCLQRNDNSGTLGTTIPERTATPETAPTLAIS
jgi:hypothetical protein